MTDDELNEGRRPNGEFVNLAFREARVRKVGSTTRVPRVNVWLSSFPVSREKTRKFAGMIDNGWIKRNEAKRNETTEWISARTFHVSG